MTVELVTGDDFSVAAQLLKDGEAFAIGLDATVKAMIVTTGHTKALTAAVDQLSSAAGANWGASLVTVIFAPGDTVDITRQGQALLEIQVDDNSEKLTWYAKIQIIKGLID